MNRSLFESDRMSMKQAFDLTVQSLGAYGERYKHWAIAFSGGKDSSATVTIVAHLIESGRIDPPESLAVLYADTRMEFPPLRESAMGILRELRDRGIQTQVVLPALDDRFFVYVLGRGVPPPKNRFRWCTAQLKIEPMLAALKSLRAEAGEKVLMLTGVRLGESAARDSRIALSCSRDGAECGQGWFQETTPEAIADTLAPLLHWRVCHVWAWLRKHTQEHGFPTGAVADVYGGDEAEERNARTGCIGCPLASRDTALRGILKQPEWAYLEPLSRLKPLYGDLSFNHVRRIRKAGGETRKNGTLAKNQQRVGPLTMEAREYGLEVVLGIQREINAAAERLGRPSIDLIDAEEEARIRELITANTWPEGWDGTEPPGDALMDQIFSDGSVQPLLAEGGCE
jgi:DNA sulfur modification protein DndC